MVQDPWDRGAVPVAIPERVALAQRVALAERVPITERRAITVAHADRAYADPTPVTNVDPDADAYSPAPDAHAYASANEDLSPGRNSEKYTPVMSHPYIVRDIKSFEAQLEERTASVDAAFFLPHLRSGMRVLDVGCGPGTITLGLAESVAPGEVVGVDLQEHLVERARALAAERGIPNVRFDLGDAYELPFDDRSFDAAFEHRVLMHLADPIRGLREVRRVLRPGGVLGLDDVDIATTVRWPMTPEFERFLELRMRAFQLQGADVQIGRRHRQLLLEAGFERAETRTVTEGGGSPDTARAHARFLLAAFEGIRRIASAQGWLDEAGLDAIAADLQYSHERPDTVSFTVTCETLGWVGKTKAKRSEEGAG